jgi:nicotinamidase-related amidase
MNENDQQNQRALIVIDVQQGLFERSTPIYRAREVLKNINLLINKARLAGRHVYFIQHSNDKTLLYGSEAWELHPEIRPNPDERIIHKKHGDAFIDTQLDDILSEKHIQELVITGLVTHGCVRATSLGALKKGYEVILVSDGHSSFSKDAAKIIEKWNRTIQRKGAVLAATQEVEFK